VGGVTVADYEGRAEAYWEIGEVVDHSRRTIFLAPDHGYSLIYHGRLDGEYWQVSRGHRRRQAGTERLFNALYKEGDTEYFIVIKRYTLAYTTEEWSGEEYTHLRHFLTQNFTVLARDDDYIVFDLGRKGGSR
jgi:hypothetical protein